MNLSECLGPGLLWPGCVPLDIDIRLHVAVLSPAPRPLEEWLLGQAEEMARRCLDAIDGFESLREPDPELKLFFNSASKVCHSLLAPGGLEREEEDFVLAGIKSDLEEWRISLLGDAKVFHDAMIRRFRRMGGSSAELARQADELMEAGAAADPRERQSAWSEAMAIYRELPVPEGEAEGLQALLVGWLQWKSQGAFDTCEQTLFRAVMSLPDSQDGLFVLATRQLAAIQAQRGDYAAALSTANRGLALREDPMGLYEAGLYATMADRPEVAYALVRRAIRRLPILALRSTFDFQEAKAAEWAA
ncbi:MAG: hypothetical protein SNJ74_03060 [Fimbriimonadaceae bacterium]